MAAQHKYRVNKKVIRGWHQQKEALCMTKKSRKAFWVHTPHWPALEDQLEEFVLEQRTVCRGLNTVQLRMKAIELAKSHNIDNFKGNPSWCYRSIKCNNLAIRQRTTIAQLPADHVEKLQPFCTFVQRQIDEHKIRNS